MQFRSVFVRFDRSGRGLRLKTQFEYFICYRLVRYGEQKERDQRAAHSRLQSFAVRFEPERRRRTDTQTKVIMRRYDYK